jgi:hypothetical protein
LGRSSLSLMVAFLISADLTSRRTNRSSSPR